MWQFLAVIIILMGAVMYAGYRIYQALTDENEACRGCALAEKCNQKRKKTGKILQCREK
jgi:hypothetical protein